MDRPRSHALQSTQPVESRNNRRLSQHSLPSIPESDEEMEESGGEEERVGGDGTSRADRRADRADGADRKQHGANDDADDSLPPAALRTASRKLLSKDFALIRGMESQSQDTPRSHPLEAIPEEEISRIPTEFLELWREGPWY